VRGPGHWHGVGVNHSSPGIVAHGPGRRRRGLLGRRRVGGSAVALAAVAATTALTLVAAVPAHGRRSGCAWGTPAIGEDALSGGPKGGGRRLGRVVWSRGAGWEPHRRGRGRTVGEASGEGGVSRMSPQVFQPLLLVAKVGHCLLVGQRGEQREP
jgi:hypothetical protein